MSDIASRLRRAVQAERAAVRWNGSDGATTRDRRTDVDDLIDAVEGLVSTKAPTEPPTASMSLREMIREEIAQVADRGGSYVGMWGIPPLLALKKAAEK